jgi:hypothetical protein
MKSRATLLMLLMTLCARCVAGRPHDTAAADPMTDFKFVIGTWQVAAEPGKTLPKYTEEMTYAAILEGKWVMSQQLLRDKQGAIVYRDCAVYGVDPDTHKLFFHAYNTDGSMDRSHAVDAPAGQWIFAGTVYGSKRFHDYRYTMTKTDDDHFGVLIELLNDGKYEKLSETHYVRKSHEATPQVQ